MDSHREQRLRCLVKPGGARGPSFGVRYQMSKVRSFNARFAENIFEQLNSKKIKFLVLSGIDEYPEKVGRDIDVYIDQTLLQRVLEVLDRIYLNSQWDFFWIHDTGLGVIQSFWVRLHNGKYEKFQLDVLYSNESLILGGAPLLNLRHSEASDKIISFYGANVDPTLYFLKGVVRKSLQAREPLRYPSILRKLGFDPDHFAGSSDIWHSLVLHTYKKTVAARNKNMSLKKQKIELNLLYAKKFPVKFVHNIIFWPARKAYSLFRNVTFKVSLVGPDGVGKSTAISNIEKALENIFEIRRYHFRPQILDAMLGRKINTRPVTDPHSDSVIAQQSILKAPIRVLFYCLDFLLFSFRIKWLASPSRTSLAIFDRGPIDAVIDPLRYKLYDQVFGRTLFFVSPKFNLQMALLDSPSAIFERKPELLTSEISRQLSGIHQLAREKKVHWMVDSGLDQAVYHSAEIMLQFMRFAWLKNVHVRAQTGPSWGVLIDGVPRLFFLNHKPSMAEIISALGWNRSLSRGFYLRWSVASRLGRVRVIPQAVILQGALVRCIGALGLDSCCGYLQIPASLGRNRVVCVDRDRNRVTKIAFGSDRPYLLQEKLGSEWLAGTRLQNFRVVPQHIVYDDGETVALQSQWLEDLAPVSYHWCPRVAAIYQEIFDLKHCYRLVSNDEFTAISDLFNLEEVQYPQEKLQFGVCHGDFSVGNIMESSNTGDICVLDWEYFSFDAPRLVDPISFHFDAWEASGYRDTHSVKSFRKKFQADLIEIALALWWLSGSGRIHRSQAVECFERLRH